MQNSSLLVLGRYEWIGNDHTNHNLYYAAEYPCYVTKHQWTSSLRMLFLSHSFEILQLIRNCFFVLLFAMLYIIIYNNVTVPLTRSRRLFVFGTSSPEIEDYIICELCLHTLPACWVSFSSFKYLKFLFFPQTKYH
jgi:hypothetical protein